MMTNLKTELEKRILVLDGAMGTMIQKLNLAEKDYRGERFASHNQLLKGNNDLLCLVKPEIISDIHRQYLEAGADIITTCTFNAQRISMADYAMEPLVREINLAAAKLARDLADEYTARNPAKPRFVVGSVGPTGKSLSISTDVNNPAFRDISFDEMTAAYTGQIEALIEGGVDAILIETIFDTLNAKAAILAMENTNSSLPVMLSATVADISGRTLSGQTMRAFLASVSHAKNLISVGLNCSFGAKELKPFLKELSDNAACYLSAYPNAGLPNQLGQYDETPEKMAAQLKEYIDEKLLNIVGGCCGTTPAHIAEYQKLIAPLHSPEEGKPLAPAIRAVNPGTLTSSPSGGLGGATILSGLEVFEIRPENNFVNIGERCNVAGSKKFLRLIKEKNYEEALNVAREQVENGAQIIDINMDDALLDAEKEMITFLNLIASEPEIARVPVMIDSSKWEVIEAGLKCVQGKSVVNSISLKEGEKTFLERAKKIRAYGAAVVVMAFDEAGQADTFERKIDICARAYKLLTDVLHFPPQDIIFDPNVLAIGTGIEQHDNYAVDFIETVRWIKNKLPYAKVSGGISNLSFSFRANNALREAIHSVFLHHAISAGLDMGIVNAGMLQVYAGIEPELLEAVEDLVLNRRADATEKLINVGAKYFSSTHNGAKDILPIQANEWRTKPLEDRIVYALMKGIDQYLPEDLSEALTVYASAIEIVEKPLMKGMNVVGELFGEGKMFLPQVVKTARTMKKAVDILQPHIENAGAQNLAHTQKQKFLIATVKGDVHDIGKNIVSVILSCNNYEVIDLGVMVPAQEIVKSAIEHKADIVGLSGLITPSLEEMTNVAQEMKKAGLSVPLFIGGAATSALHTALKIAPAYNGTVVYSKDASQNVAYTTKILNADTKNQFIADINRQYEHLREKENAKTELVDIKTAQKNRLELF